MAGDWSAIPFNVLLFLLILTNMNAHFASMEAANNAKFTSIEGKLTSVDQRIDLLTGGIHGFDNRLTRVEQRLKHR